MKLKKVVEIKWCVEKNNLVVFFSKKLSDFKESRIISA
jgi:hypothetical protein